MNPAMWLPIEANPDVMNKFLHGCGLPEEWNIQDVFGLDEELLDMLPKPVIAILLLFPITPKYEEYAAEAVQKNKDKALPDSLFFTRQMISNACGTVAMIHAVANNQDKIDLKSGHLREFLDSCKDLDPVERALKLMGDSNISGAHDEVAQEGQTAAPSVDDRVDYHFVAFVEQDGHLFDLDGRKECPIDCGKIEGGFLQAAAAECRKYMERDPENINFTVVALTKAQAESN